MLTYRITDRTNIESVLNRKLANLFARKFRCHEMKRKGPVRGTTGRINVSVSKHGPPTTRVNHVKDPFSLLSASYNLVIIPS